MKRKIKNSNERKRLRRALSVKKKISGTKERPRMTVFKSARHIYVSLIDDDSGNTICTVSSLTKEVKDGLTGKKKAERAEQIGKKMAEVAKSKGIEAVIFDRNGWPYHGRVAALAKGAREGGLQF
jgi:large subunit ribosomal protein L18